MANFQDMSQIMKLAQSPAGQQLISLIQRSSRGELEQALSKANSGDYSGAKDALSTLLSSPEAQKLLKQLEEHT